GCPPPESPNPKSKGKACEEEEDMAVDPVDVPLPTDKDNNAVGKLRDYPDNGTVESPTSTESKGRLVEALSTQ
ncbi:hypothetical protein C0989_002644, partial [Termitomyces sp. Mn162]